MTNKAKEKSAVDEALRLRFGDFPGGSSPSVCLTAWEALARHRSHRAYRPEAVEEGLVERLAALALSAPTKSDLQQRDIVVIRDPDLRARIDGLFPDSPWIATAPCFLVFCGNNRRQRQIHEWRGHLFVNDHLDAFFNAAVDAAIALASFVVAAEAAGLGCCPISAIRNHAQTVSDWLELPDWVFPVAGMTLGWPAGDGQISPRLPLEVTLHVDRFGEEDLAARVEGYDARRREIQPYAKQRFAEDLGILANYGWSEDKARQYSRPERPDFGAYVRRRGFTLE